MVRRRAPAGTCASRMCLPASVCLQMTSPHLQFGAVAPAIMRRSSREEEEDDDCQHGLQPMSSPRPRPRGNALRPLCSRCAAMVEKEVNTETDLLEHHQAIPSPTAVTSMTACTCTTANSPCSSSAISSRQHLVPPAKCAPSWTMHDIHRCTAWSSLDREDVVEFAPPSHWAHCSICRREHQTHSPTLMLVHPAWRESCNCCSQHVTPAAAPDSDTLKPHEQRAPPPTTAVTAGSGNLLLWTPAASDQNSTAVSWNRWTVCQGQQQQQHHGGETGQAGRGPGQHVYQAVVDRYQQGICGTSSSQQELTCLIQTLDRLAKCGFYHGKLAMPEAKRKLQKCQVGTFLLRESSDSKFLFSLSVRTKRGTTSIRVVYDKCRFSLECASERARSRMPSASCVLQLIQIYLQQGQQQQQEQVVSAGSDSSCEAVSDSKTGCGSSSGSESSGGSGGSGSCVFFESSGRCDTPVVLSKPLLKEPHSLRHLCRLQLNAQLANVTADCRQTILQTLSLPLQGYLQEYPYYV